MNALMTAVVMWLSANFALPATFNHPVVKFTPALEIAYLRHGAHDAEMKRSVRDEYTQAMASTKAPQVVAVYVDDTATIHLPIGWTGRSPAELSILVHELVHHLQNRSQLKYACAAEREKPAYAAQAKWLGLFGTSLAKEFAIDALALKLSTTCMY
jgi:hypothetical protein